MKYAYYKMSREELVEGERIMDKKLIFVDWYECVAYRSFDDILKQSLKIVIVVYI